ncbi:unnamed protein product [Hymenolepis diminuta]|uniref:Uncharacterized protein n=1 Tax=Hymenolepis diminuta TaxID=6216 RepID=A0A564YIN5_HYMDI|nr:unnamed protein product [Hymenolepis diminuta]
MRCKPRTIHNAQLPKDSTFPGLFSCSKKILPTRAGMYLWDHRSNDIWGKGIIKAPRGSVEVIPSKLETGPQNVILDFFGLLTLGNNGTQEIQPSNQRSLSLRCPREPSVSLAIWETSKASIRSKLKLFGQNISFYW